MLRKFKNLEEASIAAVNHMIEIASTAVSEKGFCTMVLAGGKTPQLTYELLGTAPHSGQMPWEQIHFFWGDERWLADNHPENNFSTASKYLFAKVTVPASNIHPISTGYETPEIGAEMYEKHLRDFFSSKSPLAGQSKVGDMFFPSFDLILLGMGTDGHTASIFPGSNLLEEQKKWVAAVPQGKGSPPVARISLTLPVINQARNILFLISGHRKRTILHAILARPLDAARIYPAARIKPAGNLTWLVAEKD